MLTIVVTLPLQQTSSELWWLSGG